ncbi:hypothetical protein QLQ15_18200 [Lysobacter sp. LF1]|uniref:Uncharacterized protein n=1 Tax=Lysobacter stagni TaxID=3045172 RepID=A0ABT6XKZ8_9GAMM|nr:hypothetical protein [Lysobacter sp. LF1]MDI9240838.1 hypothetical protein [Lysobacter sp. LF1]
MSTHRTAGAIPAIVIPRWPEPRSADLIDARLRGLDDEQRDALLRAVARAIDEYLATALGVGRSQPTLEAAFEEVLRQAAPALVHARADAKALRIRWRTP